jgi:hypothetical protein
MGAEALLDAAGLIRILNEHRVNYMVIGGLAAARHGVIRATRDLDVVYEGPHGPRRARRHPWLGDRELSEAQGVGTLGATGD